MADEPTRRIIAHCNSTSSHSPQDSDDTKMEASRSFESVPERASTRPEAFSEREQPTLASPNSVTAPSQGVDQRVTQFGDQLRQLDADVETIYARLEQLTDTVNTELLRGRAARIGRYLLWGAVIAAMATFWMLLRLRTGAR